MAYQYLNETNLKDALRDSEAYMKPFYQAFPEIERITKGLPGKVPEGKPRVTDGTLAGIRRETPKQIIQQLPSGRAQIKGHEDMEDYANAVLTDIILPNANSGGTPYAKAKNAIKDTISNGASAVYCFFNRRGDILSADYRRIYVKDILFEKGKVSEFDCNFMWMIGWYTLADLKAIMYQQQNLKKSKTDRKEAFDSEWNLEELQNLIDAGEQEKDDDKKSSDEKKSWSEGNGFFKIAHAFQSGVGGTFYSYAPKMDKVLRKWTNPDPRGVIPIHVLVPEEDYANPYGEPLAAISIGKQQLLDFDMQTYQYGQGLGYDPPVKKWGDTPATRIKLAPGNVIELDGSKTTDDFEVVDIGNSATTNFANNYGLLKSQILNETGRTGDTSISSASGNPGFGKTPTAIKQNTNRLSISDNDLRLSYELWQGRIHETLLNLHFAESRGTKELELESDTLKRLKLDKNPVVDYDKEFGKIKFHVNAGSAQKLSDEDMANNMLLAKDMMTPQNVYYLGQKGWKLDIGEYNKQYLQRLSIDSMDKILTKMDDKEAAEAKQQPFPIIDPPQFRMNSADLTADQVAAVLANGGVVTPPAAPPAPGQPPVGLSPQGVADFIVESQRAQAEVMKAQAASQPQPVAPEKSKTLGETVQWKPGDLKPSERAQALAQVGIQADMSNAPTPNEITQATDTATKMDKHVHDTAIAASSHTTQQLKDAVDMATKVDKHVHDTTIADHNHINQAAQDLMPETVDQTKQRSKQPAGSAK